MIPDMSRTILHLTAILHAYYFAQKTDSNAIYRLYYQYFRAYSGVNPPRNFRYIFKAKLYHSRLRESTRLATMLVVPGESYFPVQRPVLKWVRAEKPYKETDDMELTVKAGFKYGLWCADAEQIKMNVLGPYK